MRSNRAASLAVPILVIAVGIGWLLTARGLFPEINWVWTLGLAAAGVLTIVLAGFDKVSVVIGPFFLLASMLSVLRQTGGLDLNTEVPLLVISVGVLLLVSHLPSVPPPSWMVSSPAPPAEETDRPKKLRL